MWRIVLFWLIALLWFFLILWLVQAQPRKWWHPLLYVIMLPTLILTSVVQISLMPTSTMTLVEKTVLAIFLILPLGAIGMGASVLWHLWKKSRDQGRAQSHSS